MSYFLEAESELKIARYKMLEKQLPEEAAVSEVYKPVFINDNGLVSLSVLIMRKNLLRLKFTMKTKLNCSMKQLAKSMLESFDIKCSNDKFTLRCLE
jgi:hypothetical protein